MDIGIPKEIRAGEARVALTPAAVHTLVADGHRVFIEADAGLKAGFSSEEYRTGGAEIVYSREEAIGRGELILMISAPLPEDYELFEPRQILSSFILLAVQPVDATRSMVDKHMTVIGFEIIEDRRGYAPVLQAMSEIGGPLAVQMAARFLETPEGGRGILLGNLPGTAPAHVVILGGGAVGANAARSALGLGAEVTVFDIDSAVLRHIHDRYDGRIVTRFPHRPTLEKLVATADVLVGAVSVHGERTPALISRAVVERMKKGSVIVDVAIDAGGCVETSRPTTINHPVFVEADVIHCCIPNLPAMVARTASYVFANAALPYIRRLASLGPKNAAADDPTLAAGFYIDRGRIVKSNIAAELERAVQTV